MFNVAIIGAGVWSENHRTGWNAHHDARIACVVRSSAAAAEDTARRWGVEEWDDDYRRVLQRDDIDIVDILLPHHLHVDVALAALAAGKHVLMEKPLAITLGDAQRLIDAGQHADRKIMISENWDYASVVRWAKERLDAGDIGAPFLLRTTLEMDVRGGFTNLRWRHDAGSMGGGALLDAGTHPVSACR
jgi:predicted dehydrogenase